MAGLWIIRPIEQYTVYDARTGEVAGCCFLVLLIGVAHWQWSEQIPNNKFSVLRELAHWFSTVV